MSLKQGRPNRPYQDDFRKDSKTKNVFRKRKDMLLSSDIQAEKRENIILWNTFFRRNIGRFVEMYMGVRLFPYQILWLWLMNQSDVFVAIASRAAAKSFLVAVFGIAQCILYPGSEVVIGASTVKQAGLIISSKVTALRNQSPILQREIISLSTSLNDYRAVFANGSTMVVVAANEGGKGNRSTFLILDEFRLLKKEIVDEIFTPFLYVRQAAFKQDPKYSDYPEEEPRKFSISSAGYRQDWWWRDTVSTIRLMLDGKKAGFFCTDYLVSVFHKIKTKHQMETEKEQSDPISFAMEYENQPMGQSGKAYFKSQMFSRNIKGAFYPMRQDNVSKKNPYSIPRQDGEKRVLAVDIASRANRANDNSIVGCARLIPTHRGYTRKLCYLESSHGSNTISQALRIKELFYDFGADYLVLDLQQVGISIFDSMSSVTVNSERGIEYPAFTVLESPYIDEKVKEELRDRTLGVNALPVVFPISATQKLNSDIAVAFRGTLQKKLWDFLATDLDAEDHLIKTSKEFLHTTEDDLSMRTWMLHPYVQTNLLVGECLNLEMSIVNNTVKLDEGSGLKDRYTAVSYLNYFVSTVLDRELLRQGDDMSDEEAILAITMAGI
jgi:hypothetical protein